jgi:large subunit ribosomal protein L35
MFNRGLLYRFFNMTPMMMATMMGGFTWRIPSYSQWIYCRGVKTRSAVKKRFFRTGSGGLKRFRSGRNHFASSKSSRQLTHLSQPTMVNRTQLRLLNKMLQD